MGGGVWCQQICCGGRSPASALRGSRVQACGAPRGERLLGNYLSPIAGSGDRLEADARGAWIRGHFYLRHALQLPSPEKKKLCQNTCELIYAVL